ncbi:glycosyl hydrolase [Paenibacillus sp. FSL F4-0243]|uniref:glycosyl hydrolase n=1 Tax=Paenibacillus sp. FSL F4-0243 TaxID=2954732 RepID=UPI0030DC2009
MRKYYKQNRLLFTILPVFIIFSLLPWGEVKGLPKAMSVSSALPPAIPSNPSASEEAKQLLSNLVNLRGKGILSGQHDYLESPDELVHKLKNTSGQNAVLHGYELGAINNQPEGTIAEQRQAVIDSAMEWHQEGGIVAMTFHQSLPGTSPEWSNVNRSLSQEKFNTYVTPGTAQYKSLISDLDEIAGYLGQLRDAGVPVLWRPYHEMNGGWFWWGKKDNFSALWNIVYDRFVNTHQLNNLLWVWNPNAPNEWADPYAAYYPGADKLDVLAADIYNNDYKQSYYEDLLALADGKPIGIGESGQLPNPEILTEKQNKWVYMMTWGKLLTENNTLQSIKSFMNDSFIVSREDYVLTTGGPSIAPVIPVTLAGLNGEYYNNTDLEGEAVLIRDDRKIDFNWHGGSPAQEIDEDHFSVRWKGKLKPKFSEKYTISASSDDGVRVWIDGKLIIDNWKNQSATLHKGSIPLTAGTLYDIQIEYYENEGDANLRLLWESSSQKQQVIPQGALFLP